MLAKVITLSHSTRGNGLSRSSQCARWHDDRCGVVLRAPVSNGGMYGTDLRRAQPAVLSVAGAIQPLFPEEESILPGALGCRGGLLETRQVVGGRVNQETR